MKPVFFASPSKLRAWLQQHHARKSELWIGFHKKGSGKPSITWVEAVDALLCFGWIDGIRKSVNATSYAIHVTPRKHHSKWSAINVSRVHPLKKLGLLQSAGLLAFEIRTAENTYSCEQRNAVELGARYQRQFSENKAAWKFFRSRTPYYQRTATWWVISAKKEQTRLKRLATLIAGSQHQQLIGPLRRPTKSK